MKDNFLLLLQGESNKELTRKSWEANRYTIS